MKGIRLSHFYHANKNFRFCRCFSSEKWVQPEGYKTDIKINNPVTRNLSPLVLRNENQAFWYTCGPTVYDSAHIGHASSYVRIDIIHRILRNYFNIDVTTAMNITDIDDKIIKKSQEEKCTWNSVAEKYEAEFWDDLDALNVTRPDIVIHVTKNMNKIIRFIDKIMKTGNAYVTEKGSVNFLTKNWDRYGKLVNITKEPSSKEDEQQRADFALWKAAKENEPSWPSPWGPGRPGWHIECSTLASHLFGNSITFHAGGVDLKFPHHENEEAQSCCFHNTDQWVDYWVHTGPLMVKGDLQKMSKSLKNTVSIQQLLQNYTADEFRMLCILTRYRSNIDFDNDTMVLARSTLRKFVEFLDNCTAYVTGVKPAVNFDGPELLKIKSKMSQMIIENFKEDFNVPRAIDALFSLVTETNSLINAKPTENSELIVGSNVVTIQQIKNFIQQHLNTLGLTVGTKLPHSVVTSQRSSGLSSDEIIESIVQLREKVRNEAMTTKDKSLFKFCDLLRDNLNQHGVEVKDHGKGSSWHFK